MEIKVKTREGASPNGKPRVYFCCHKDDFSLYFERIANDILKTHDCAIYYTADMEEPFPADSIATDLESNNLFVVPVTRKLLTEKNRAMDFDIAFTKKKKLPLLPFMMEKDIVSLYSKKNKFGDIQYLDPNESDITAISHKEKLKKYLDAVLVSEETAKRVRAAFDAYVFLSYRKKDRRYANELMRLIHENEEFRDIAIWYDEFLTPGESFKDNIDKILQDSKLFALLVTPSLLEEPNYVMDNEYPAAKASKMDILPTEMEKTDKNALKSKYKDIPECIDPRKDSELKKPLLSVLEKAAIKENKTDPEHTYLMGIAYLEGIDVEVDRERGIELIKEAANAGNAEAMLKLFCMYKFGEHLPLDYKKALFWMEKIYEAYINKEGSDNTGSLSVLLSLATAYGDNGEYKKECKLLEKIYTSQCELLGEDHEDTLLTLITLSRSYNRQNDHEKAIEIQNKLYQKYLKEKGEDHIDTVYSLGALAVTCRKINENEKAIELGEKAYEGFCLIYGKDSRFALEALLNIANAYESMGENEKALKMEKDIYLKMCEVLGEEHPEAIGVLTNIAYIYQKTDEHIKALRLTKKVYPLTLKALGPKHPQTVDAKYNLKAAKKTIKIIKIFLFFSKTSYYILKLFLGQGNQKTLASMQVMLSLYDKLEDYKSEHRIWSAFYRRYKKVIENDPKYLSFVKETLSELEEKMKNPKENV